MSASTFEVDATAIAIVYYDQGSLPMFCRTTDYHVIRTPNTPKIWSAAFTLIESGDVYREIDATNSRIFWYCRPSVKSRLIRELQSILSLNIRCSSLKPRVPFNAHYFLQYELQDPLLFQFQIAQKLAQGTPVVKSSISMDLKEIDPFSLPNTRTTTNVSRLPRFGDAYFNFPKKTLLRYVSNKNYSWKLANKFTQLNPLYVTDIDIEARFPASTIKFQMFHFIDPNEHVELLKQKQLVMHGYGQLH